MWRGGEGSSKTYNFHSFLSYWHFIPFVSKSLSGAATCWHEVECFSIRSWLVSFLSKYRFSFFGVRFIQFVCPCYHPLQILHLKGGIIWKNTYIYYIFHPVTGTSGAQTTHSYHIPPPWYMTGWHLLCRNQSLARVYLHTQK